VIFEWDHEKNDLNKEKHGLSFELASLVFHDPNLLSWVDNRFDYDEERWISLGAIKSTLILVVVHLVKEESDGQEKIRIISARKATKQQRELYVRGSL